MSQQDFAYKLIKGRIAEVIFEQMLREAGNFTVLPFGYEYTFPKVAQMKNDTDSDPVVDVLKSAPDFVVINNDTKGVSLVEVKYRKNRTLSNTKEEAEKIFKLWKPAYLFIASPDGFFFDKVEDIVEKKGDISPFPSDNTSDRLQKKYLGLLNTFEGDCKD